MVIHYNRSEQSAEDLAGRIRSLGRQAWVIPGDLSDPQATQRLYDLACDQAGRAADILVNNASIFPPSKVLDFTPQELAQNVQVNAMAPLQLARAMARRAESGDVINLLDARVVDYDAAHAAYHLSKRMAYSLTRMLAMELAPAIRVNAVAPGLILPPPGQDESYLARLAHTNPLGRSGSPEEVARAVVFLVSSEFVTGQVIFVDGGRHMKGRMYD